MKVDLNADLAEGCGSDEALLKLITSANVACAQHAGSPDDMLAALRLAKQNGVRVGAHPAYADREHFGREAQHLSGEQLEALLLYQLGALQALCDFVGVQMAYVKPHGALYNQAAKDITLARQIAAIVKAFNPDLKLMGLSGSCLLQAAQEHGLGCISEVFADRRYMPDGTLVSRARADAQVQSDEEALAQVLDMVSQGRVRAIDGSWVAVKADSICLHGDGEHAIAFAKVIRQLLEKHDFL